MLLVAQWGVREVSGRYPGVLLGGWGRWGSGRWADGGPGDVERAGWCRLGWGAREESSAGLVRVGGVQRGSKEGTGGPGGAKGVRGGSGGLFGGGGWVAAAPTPCTPAAACDCQVGPTTNDLSCKCQNTC